MTNNDFFTPANHFAIAFINAGVNLLTQNPLHGLLYFEANDTIRCQQIRLEPTILLVISKLFEIVKLNGTEKPITEKILQQAAFLIIEQKLSKEYLRILLDSGISINTLKQAKNESSEDRALLEAKEQPEKNEKQSINLFQSACAMIDKSLPSALSHLEVMCHQFSHIDLQELNKLLYQICLKFTENAARYSKKNLISLKVTLLKVITTLIQLGADISAHYDKIGIIKICETFACTEIQTVLLTSYPTPKTASPKQGSIATITQVLTAVSSTSVAGEGSEEEAKQDQVMHSSPVKANFCKSTQLNLSVTPSTNALMDTSDSPKHRCLAP